MELDKECIIFSGVLFSKLWFSLSLVIRKLDSSSAWWALPLTPSFSLFLFLFYILFSIFFKDLKGEQTGTYEEKHDSQGISLERKGGATVPKMLSLAKNTYRKY